MSIVALKKKTAAKYNNMSVNVQQFSINGGFRNQGWVGQTSISRSLIKTPHRGATPRGHGGCCGTYNMSIVKPLEPCTNNNEVVKSSVVSTDGMLDMKYRWIRRPAPYTSVKPDVNHNLNQQGEYINRIKKKTLNATTRQCPSIPKQSCNLSCDLFKTRTSMKAGIDNFTKNVGPIDQSEYVSNTNDQCILVDEEFQKEMNTKPSSTPFGC
jgi:hypothetical protein|tara:strand:+ start:678 stop:1310 length:633 start_codon:yes stop_codon:yes gene_type:complete